MELDTEWIDGIILDISRVRQQGRRGEGNRRARGASSMHTQSNWHGPIWMIIALVLHWLETTLQEYMGDANTCPGTLVYIKLQKIDFITSKLMKTQPTGTTASVSRAASVE